MDLVEEEQAEPRGRRVTQPPQPFKPNTPCTPGASPSKEAAAKHTPAAEGEAPGTVPEEADEEIPETPSPHKPSPKVTGEIEEAKKPSAKRPLAAVTEEEEEEESPVKRTRAGAAAAASEVEEGKEGGADEAAGARHAKEANHLRDYNCPALSGNPARPEKRSRGGSHSAAPAAASSLKEEVEQEEGVGRAEKTARPSARRVPPAAGGAAAGAACGVQPRPKASVAAPHPERAAPAVVDLVEEEQAEPRGRRSTQPRQAFKPNTPCTPRGAETSPSKEAGGKRASSAEEGTASQEEMTSPSGRKTRVAEVEQEGEGRKQMAREANSLRDFNCRGTVSTKQFGPRTERRVSQLRQAYNPSAYEQSGATGGGWGGSVAAGKHATAAEEEVASQEEMVSPSGKRRRATVVEQEEVQADSPAAGARGAGRGSGGGAGVGPEGARGAQEGGEARTSKEVRQLGSIFPSFTHYAAPLAERRATAPPQNFNPSGRGGAGGNAVRAPAPEEESPSKRTRTAAAAPEEESPAKRTRTAAAAAAAEEEDRGQAGQRHGASAAEGREEGEGGGRGPSGRASRPPLPFKPAR